jgi:glycosyltransferase involved in cell wall biosynthesis
MLRPPVMPRRLLMTCDAIGGVWRYAIDIARTLEANGTEVLLVGCGPPPSSGQHDDASGLRVAWLDHPPAWLATDPGELDGLGAALARLQTGFGAELMHLNLPAEAAGLDVEVPVVVAAHSCLATWWQAVRRGPPPRAWGWKIARDREGFARADAMIAPSAAHAAAMAAAHPGVDVVRVVPNAAAAPPAPAAKLPFVMGAARWWDEGKNLAAIDAAARTTAWPIILCGAVSGPDGTHVRIRNAIARGPCPAAEVHGLMRHAAIFASPSLYEPFGLAPLEAAHAGAALVLADIATYRELWDGAALFVAPHDHAGLAAALDAVATDADRRGALAHAAMARARTFTTGRQLDALAAAYAAAVVSYARHPLPAAAE